MMMMTLLIRGINVLESKSELEKAMAKQRLAAEQKQKEAEVTSKEREETNPEFKRVLAERAKRLERLEAEDSADPEEREDEGQPAKAKEVFQRLEGRMEEGVRAGKKSVPTRGSWWARRWRWWAATAAAPRSSPSSPRSLLRSGAADESTKRLLGQSLKFYLD